MKTPDDATLLQAVGRRDEAAFADLYDRLSRPVFSLIVRVLGSRAEAEEVLQEAFWQIWERAPEYQPELGSAFSWVVTIARRRAIDRLRANSRHLQRIEQAQAMRNSDDVVAPAGLEAIAASEEGDAVRAALAGISDDERRAIALAFFDGLTHEEIAGVMEAPVGTVKAWIRRGMLKIEAHIGEGAPRGGGMNDPMSAKKTNSGGPPAVDAQSPDPALLSDHEATLALAVPVAAAPSPKVKEQLLSRIRAANAVTANITPPGWRFESVGAEEGWRGGVFPGLRFKTLSVDEQRDVVMVLIEMAAGARFPDHMHDAGGDEGIVLSGDVITAGRLMRAGDYYFAAEGTAHTDTISPSGCTALVTLTARAWKKWRQHMASA